MDGRGGLAHCGRVLVENCVLSNRAAFDQGHRKAQPRRPLLLSGLQRDSLGLLTNHFTFRHSRFAPWTRGAGKWKSFFKWVKQCLRIKRLFGTSENAVKSQLRITVATCVLMAIVKKRLSLDLSLHGCH